MKPGDVPLERVSLYKVLAVTIIENLLWNEHISKSIRSAYLSLKSQRQLERFTPYHVRKNLAEAFVLSIKDANALFYSIPKYLYIQMERVHNATASFVYRKYAQDTGVLTLSWLPIRERIEFSIARLAFKISLVICATQLAGGVLLENAKTF